MLEEELELEELEVGNSREGNTGWLQQGAAGSCLAWPWLSAGKSGRR